MEHDQSVAWATAIRGMQVANHIAVMPHIKISRQYSPGPHDLQEQLQTCYKQYLDVYHNYTSYQINPGINRTAS